MKKVALFLSALFAVALVNAQSNKEEVDLMQAAFGMEKKAMVEEFVIVDAAQKDAFWKLYDEYETARKEFGKKRIDLLNQYAENYDKLTVEFADKWGAEVINLGKDTDALLNSYYAKIKKATNAVVALQFYQVEGYILSGIRLSILEELPLPDIK
jgi:BioD-like phosphotransacetylase family protein